MNKDSVTFDEWWSECCKLDPGNLKEHELSPAPAGFADVWLAIYRGGFTPQEATAEARISLWLESLDEPHDVKLKLVE